MKRAVLAIILVAIAATGFEIPDSIRNDIEKQTGPLGRTYWQIEQFRPADYTLATVRNMFEDIENAPRFSGRLSDMLMENIENPAAISRIAWAQLGSISGMGSNPEEGWGVELSEDPNIDDNPEGWFRTITEDPINGNSFFNNHSFEQWQELPENLQIMITRIYLEAREVMPYITEALPTVEEPDLRTFRARNTARNQNDDGNDLLDENGNFIDPNGIQYWDGRALYDFLMTPWGGEDVSLAPFRQLDEFDMGYMALAQNSFTRAVFHAIEEAGDISFKGEFRVRTTFGDIAVGGDGNNEFEGDHFLIIDTGGDDIYGNRTALATDGIACVIDMSGNDRYQTDAPGLGTGIRGIGLLVDIEGNDSYSARESGIARGLYGGGMLVDMAGNDRYISDSLWGQGAAHAGTGILIDVSGRDEYICWSEAQGFGGTYGFGLLLDGSGDDIYTAPKEGRYSDAFSETISFCQGAAFGRRADGWDGHTMAGGIGVLVDGGGNDSYSAQVYAQGTAYWWSLGILEDMGGDDRYESIWYSLGSAPHFAVGSAVDRQGNDTYNVGNEGTRCQYQGCARDGSFGVFIDGAGDDSYLFKNRCAGGGDLNSIALFWDISGNDSYAFNPDSPYPDEPAMGSAAFYEPTGSYRDRISTVGIFLDTGGEDSYPDGDPANNSIWTRHRGKVYKAIGIDR